MKTLRYCFTIILITCGPAGAQEVVSYLNYIRQFQMPAGVTWDASDTVASTGSKLSALAINPGGARFELWTIKSSSVTGLTGYPLESCYVGTYIPVATVVVRSEDTTSSIPRTRADRPFFVDISLTGLRNGATDPEPSKSVKFFRHVQSYGTGGTGVGIDRTQATLLTQSSITTNGNQTLTYPLTMIPGGNRSKIRGEERFSIFSLEDYQAPESQLASQFIQIWPVANGTISGIVQNQKIKFTLPSVTLALNDLYPFSTTYAQVYKGNQVLGTSGAIVPGSAVVISDSIPQNRLLSLTNYDSVFTSDGVWTMEIVTVNPFPAPYGVTRLGWVTFTVDRTIDMNSTVTTIE
jgi:hypothetical protein